MNKNDYKDLENQGWNDLFQTLEREMPTEKKRRRDFLWFFFAFGIAAAISCGYWYAQRFDTVINHHIEPKPQPKNTSTVIDETTNYINNQTATIVPQIAHEHPSVNSHLNKPNNLLVTQKTDNQGNNVIVSNRIQAESSPTIIASVNNLTTNNTGIYENKSAEIQIPNTEPIIHQNDLAVTTKTEANTEISILNSIDLIKTAPLSIEHDTTHKIEPLPIIVKPQNEKINHKLSWGITTGIHTEIGQKLDGFQAGSVLNKPLNRRWALGTGLNFRQTSTSGDSITYYKADYLYNAPSPSSVGLQNTTPISLEKLYYLEIPLTIQYRFNQRWAVSTGVKAAYLLGQSTRTSGNSVFWLKSASNFSNGQVLLDKVNTQTLGLNRWDVSWINRFSYTVNRHLIFDLRYDLGFANIVKLKNWAAYNRYLQLNATYLF